jgi:hypothetical protein
VFVSPEVKLLCNHRIVTSCSQVSCHSVSRCCRMVPRARTKLYLSTEAECSTVSIFMSIELGTSSSLCADTCRNNKWILQFCVSA